MTEHDITKALEIWTLQNLLNISIMLGILACGLTLMQNYYRALEKHLSLRVSIELWRVTTVVLVDVLLAMVVVVGYVVLNPDIMADIKIAVPFCPIATIFFAAALCLRLFHGGHHPASPELFAGTVSAAGRKCLQYGRVYLRDGGGQRRVPGTAPESVLDVPQDALAFQRFAVWPGAGPDHLHHLFSLAVDRAGLGRVVGPATAPAEARGVADGLGVGTDPPGMHGLRHLRQRLPAQRHRHDAPDGLSGTGLAEVRGLSGLRPGVSGRRDSRP